MQGIKQWVQGGWGPVLRMRRLASAPWASFYLCGLLLNSKYMLRSSTMWLQNARFPSLQPQLQG